jgi:hypothetical protein
MYIFESGKKNIKYKKYKVLIKKFFDDINQNTNFFAIDDHTCCNSCGHAEIKDVCNNTNKKAYMFYNMQTSDSINDDFANNKKIIEVYLSYGSFDQILDKEELDLCCQMFDTIKELCVNYNWIDNFEWTKTMDKKMLLTVKNIL